MGRHHHCQVDRSFLDRSFRPRLTGLKPSEVRWWRNSTDRRSWKDQRLFYRFQSSRNFVRLRIRSTISIAVASLTCLEPFSVESSNFHFSGDCVDFNSTVALSCEAVSLSSCLSKLIQFPLDLVYVTENPSICSVPLHDPSFTG